MNSFEIIIKLKFENNEHSLLEQTFESIYFKDSFDTISFRNNNEINISGSRSKVVDWENFESLNSNHYKQILRALVYAYFFISEFEMDNIFITLNKNTAKEKIINDKKFNQKFQSQNKWKQSLDVEILKGLFPSRKEEIKKSEYLLKILLYAIESFQSNEEEFENQWRLLNIIYNIVDDDKSTQERQKLNQLIIFMNQNYSKFYYTDKFIKENIETLISNDDITTSYYYDFTRKLKTKKANIKKGGSFFRINKNEIYIKEFLDLIFYVKPNEEPKDYKSDKISNNNNFRYTNENLLNHFREFFGDEENQGLINDLNKEIINWEKEKEELESGNNYIYNHYLIKYWYNLIFEDSLNFTENLKTECNSIFKNVNENDIISNLKAKALIKFSELEFYEKRNINHNFFQEKNFSYDINYIEILYDNFEEKLNNLNILKRKIDLNKEISGETFDVAVYFGINGSYSKRNLYFHSSELPLSFLFENKKFQNLSNNLSVLRELNVDFINFIFSVSEGTPNFNIFC